MQLAMIKFETHSIWIDELEIAIYAFDDIRTDCTGMSMLVSAFLKRHGIEHRCMHGSVHHKPSNSYVAPHYWIELGQDIIVDIRLRMWLGDNDSIPHGVFATAMTPDLVYRGKQAQVPSLSSQELDEITEGRSARLHLPRLH